MIYHHHLQLVLLGCVKQFVSNFNAAALVCLSHSFTVQHYDPYNKVGAQISL
jgi:hypothetical protein